MLPRPLLFLALSAALVSCSVEAPDERLGTSEDVRQLIDRSLAPGDSIEAIEAFLEENGFPVSYNPWDNSYYVTIRDVGPWPDGKIDFTISLDKDKKYTKSKVVYLLK